MVLLLPGIQIQVEKVGLWQGQFVSRFLVAATPLGEKYVEREDIKKRKAAVVTAQL